MHGMMRTRSVVSAPRACRGGGYRRFRRNARAPWVNCWRRPSPLGAGPRCPWIGSRHGMTWQRPTACSRMGAAVRLLLSRSLPHPAHGAVHARRHASAPWLKYAAARWRDVSLDGWRVARAGAQTVQALWPDAATSGLVTDGMALAVTRPATPADLQLAAGARRHWLADRLWLYGQPAGVLVFDTPQDVPELIRSLSGQQPALVDLRVLPGQVLLSGKVGDAQWVARMEAVGARRTVGSISQVRLGAPAAFVPPAWLPADASLKLDFEIQEDGRRVREQIWRSALSPRRAQALAQRRLRDAGWRAARVPAGAAQRWERDGAALQWTATPVEQGSGIWIRSWTR